MVGNIGIPRPSNRFCRCLRPCPEDSSDPMKPGPPVVAPIASKPASNSGSDSHRLSDLEPEPNASELLSVVYDKLRRLAAQKMAHEQPGQTLQPTALVHEAWLRLGHSSGRPWDSREHFFAAAAEAMRRILIDRARRRARIRHGGEWTRVDAQVVDLPLLTMATSAFGFTRPWIDWPSSTRARRRWLRCVSSSAWRYRKSPRCWGCRKGASSGTGCFRKPGCPGNCSANEDSSNTRIGRLRWGLWG